MRKEYPLELKKRVTARVISGELSAGVAAAEYGLRHDQVRRWVEQFGGSDSNNEPPSRDGGKGSKNQLQALEAEVKRLQRELQKAEAERDFLKKAASYFARATP